MTNLAIIELEQPCHRICTSRLGPSGKPVLTEGMERETLLYSVYDLDSGFCAAEYLFQKCHEGLAKAVWTMADSCTKCDYWTATYLWTNDDLNRLTARIGHAVATGHWGLGHVQRKDESGALRLTSEGGYALASIPHGTYPSIEWILLGHDPANHFYAVPTDSNSGQTLERIHKHPDAYSEAIELLSSSMHVLDDSHFEVTAFGPDGDHLSIAYSPTFTRAKLQQILQTSYGIPYYRVQLSSTEYDLWLNGHSGFEVDLGQRIPLGKTY